MTASRNTEKTAVVATFSARRDAEIARDYLIASDIQAFVSADDAGGMHPQLQAPHGVKVVTLSNDAEAAHEELDEADLLPGSGSGAHAPAEREREEGSLTFSMAGWAGTLGAVAVLLVLLWFLSQMP